MESRTLRRALTIAVITALLGCGIETSELAPEPGGWPEPDTDGGHRLFEGDIVLDDEPEVIDDEASTAAGIGAAAEPLFAVSADGNLWPHARIPYTIHSSVSTPGRVRDALRIWEATGVDFVPRTTERAYVTFIEEPGHSVCSAQVGYNGGHRYVYLRDTAAGDDPCNLGVLVHEIGHTLGFWHEHTRPDRDSYVTIHWRFVPSAYREAYEIKRSGVRRVGAYDITSSMHYRSTTLTLAGGSAITRRDGTRLLHDWSTLSRGDVAAIRTLYFDGAPLPRPAATAPAATAPDAGAPAPTAPDSGAGGAPALVAPEVDPRDPFVDPSIGRPPLPIGDDDDVVDDPGADGVGDDLELDRSMQGGCSLAPASGRGARLAALLVVACVTVSVRRRVPRALRARRERPLLPCGGARR